MKRFRSVAAQAPKRSNAQMSQDFIDLFFRLETGDTLPAFTRFEGPVFLRVIGRQIPAALNVELTELLARIDREAGLPITRVSARDAASVTIELVPRSDLNRRAPNTACIVAPAVSSWSEYRKGRGVSWTTLTTRTRVAIFIPEGVAAQEMRDCLHEELAQALGPLNDLYRLPDSTFNDDNIHSVLTGFDMLMLRAAYAPELRSGMSRDQVAALIPGLLDRLNPRGRNGGTGSAPNTTSDWITQITRALNGGSTSTRRLAAKRAVAIADAHGWRDTRTGLANLLLGRLSMSSDTQAARSALNAAQSQYKGSTLTELHAANVAIDLAALALVERDFAAAFTIASNAIPAATRAQDAALLSSLMMIKAEALARQGRASEAQAVRLDSLGWARYGFGSDKDVAARAADISALAQPR